MAKVTLKFLHNYLKVLDNPSELKRRLPASSTVRTLKEGLNELCRALGVEEAAFKDAPIIAALIGSQRFVMIWGEPSATEHVARVFDNSRMLLTGLMAGTSLENAAAGQGGAGPQQGGAIAARSNGMDHRKSDAPADLAEPDAELETPLESLKPMLAGNKTLAGRLFRALFEHMLGFAPQSSAPQGSVSLVNDLVGSKDHGRSFLSTAMFILGAEIDRDNLMSFMMQQGLFGMPIFEHLLQNRDYCEAFYAFRSQERAFMGLPAAEESQLRNRLDQFNAQYGGKPYGTKLFEADEQDKARIDAWQAATDLLEAMALTPWCLSLNNAVSIASAYSVRSVAAMGGYFERAGRGEITKDHANQEIADHLLAFARQFSADSKAG